MQAKMKDDDCYYCGHVPGDGEKINGLDRIEAGEKYDDGNTVSCCGVCNTMKMLFQTDEFIGGVHAIMAFRGGEIGDAHLISRPSPFSGTAQRREAATKDKTNELDMDAKIMLWSSECYMCGRAPALGIDRIDLNKNYTTENCKSCCTLCNYIKKDWTEEEFLEHVARIHAHTALRVLGDTRDILNNGITGPRKPVAPIDNNGQPVIIFPSESVISKILAGGGGGQMILKAIQDNKRCHGYFWRFVDVQQYKMQCMSAAECKKIISNLIVNKK